MAERRLVLAGEIDIARLREVRAELRRLVTGTDAHLLVDCAQMTFIDMAGIAALLEAHAILEEQGRRMLIANVRPQFRRAFQLLGVDDLLTSDPIPSQCRRRNGRPIRAPII